MQIIELPTDVIIKYSSMWDGLADDVSDAGTLGITNGRIVNITDMPTSSVTLDFSNFTVMPSLIDCHVHLDLPYNRKETSVDRAQRLLEAGIGAIRDSGSRQASFSSQSPLTIVHTGHAISRAGHYGTNLGTAVQNVSEAEQLIAKLADSGAKQIKIIASGIFSFSNYGDTGAIPFTTYELARMVAQANTYGLKVMAHATGNEAVLRCIEAGVDSIEHGYFMTEHTLEKLATTKIPWIPTLIPVAVHLSAPHLLSRLTVLQRETVSRTLARHQQLVTKAATLGVCIGAGTDAGAIGVPHGTSLSWELAELANCGLSFATVLKSATSFAAKICDLPNRGMIAPGMQPPLLVVAQNPLEQITTLQHPIALLV